MEKNKTNINLEKVGIYIGAVVFMLTTWCSLFQIHAKFDDARKEIDVRERVKALEIKIEHMEKCK